MLITFQPHSDLNSGRFFRCDSSIYLYAKLGGFSLLVSLAFSERVVPVAFR